MVIVVALAGCQATVGGEVFIGDKGYTLGIRRAGSFASCPQGSAIAVGWVELTFIA